MSLRTWRLGLVTVALAAVAVVAVGAPALAHGGEDLSDRGLVLVRQAIAMIVSSPGDVGEIGERIAAAQAAPDPSGVDLELVDQAADALGAGDLQQTRLLLERSIGAAPVGAAPAETAAPGQDTAGDTAGQEPSEADPSAAAEGAGEGEMATGAAPGGTVISEPLDPRPRLDATDWTLLAGSLVVGLVGVWLVARDRSGREVTR